MSLSNCEEFVGPATATGQRKTCRRPPTHLAQNVNEPGTTVALCGRHVKDYDSPYWRLVKLPQ